MASPLRGLVLLSAIAVAGETLRQMWHLPVPGPVIGIVMLVTMFTLRRAPLPSIEAGSRPLLAHLSLMFIPLAAAITTQLSTLARHGPLIATALCGSSVLALLTTAFVLRGLDTLLDTPRTLEPEGTTP